MLCVGGCFGSVEPMGTSLLGIQRCFSVRVRGLVVVARSATRALHGYQAASSLKPCRPLLHLPPTSPGLAVSVL